jgi:hypothetical protein
MKIKLQNLGVVKMAEIDLCKKLSLFCGPNSTGKTYVAYLIYGITKLLMVGVPLFKIQDLLEKNELSFTLEYKELFQLQRQYLKYIKDNIATEFASKPDFFSDFDLQIITSQEDFTKDLKSSQINYNYEFAEVSILLKKESNSDIAKVILQKPITLTNVTEKYEVYILAVLSKYLINNTLTNSFILPVERNSVYTFSKELSLKRLKKSVDNKDIDDLEEIQERQTRYPHALRDALAVAEDLANIKNKETKFKYLADEIELEILNGTILVSDQGELQFFSNNDKDKILPIHLSASLIKTLSGLIIYLRHQATSNDLIIIDEPELNLHPDNQILLARIFARLVNSGFRLLISTHSDYIIRELNNLIMLSSKTEATAKMIEQFGYKDYHKLNPSFVGAYLFNFNADNNTKVVVENLDIKESGFEVKTIDEAINKLNDVSEELFYALKSSNNE